MIFNSFNFIVLFPLIFLLYYAIPARLQRARNMYLLVVSYALYINWKPVYALVLLGVTAVSYLFARWIERSRNSKAMMVLGVVITLLPLLFFKYFDFINENICGLLDGFGLHVHLMGLNWAIPIGISFFTFQALSYIWDVYYKKISAEHDFLLYALYLSFFPSILSGPINRASLVIPQLKNLRTYFDYPKAVEGLKMLLWGMFMKVVVADRVALYVDTIFSSYENYTGLSCLMASILYSIQIYADFAGYSFMAIGVGKVLGFELTENFRRPYFAVSVTDFWHRWHISLSTWLRDYVYIPMGGSKCSKLRNYINIFVTFLVSGIWHGANWTFIVWGCMHGICQIMEKILGLQKCNYRGLGKIVRIVTTFLIVNFAWIFFRMPTLTDACSVISRIFDPTLPMTIYMHGFTATFFMCFGLVILMVRDITSEFFPKHLRLLHNKNVVIRWSTYLFIMVSIMLTGVFSSDQFIYANF